MFSYTACSQLTNNVAPILDGIGDSRSTVNEQSATALQTVEKAVSSEILLWIEP